MTHDVAKQVRGYMMVFGTLLVLTLITVGVSYLDLPEVETVVVALVIATTKASLVAMFFMHLKFERWNLRILFIIPLPLAVILILAVISEKVW
jgi:cytochrome c oxidase subunit 4